MSWLKDDVSLIGFVGAITVLLLTASVALFYVKKMKTSKASGDLSEHSWDGIREFKNDVPVGWLLSLLAAVIWAVWYMIFGYPLSSYSQIGEYNEEVKSYNSRFQSLYSSLGRDELIEMGQGIFSVQCAQCHGLTAEGNGGKAQNLTRWGGVDGIIDTIKNGSKGLDYGAGEMPAGLLDDEQEMRDVATYVMSELVKDTSVKYNSASVESGRVVFENNCAMCHGLDGTGNIDGMDGFAADLTKYGKFDFIKHVLTNGKKGNIGRMPSFSYLNFNDTQLRALEAFIGSRVPIR